MKQYQEINFGWGNTIEHAVNELLEYKDEGILAYGEFNGVILHSDTVTMDDAYRRITGKTKAELDQSQQEWRERAKKEEAEHKDQIPELTKEWMMKGREILSEDKWDYWDEIVPVRLGDLYHGMELGNCLDIIETLKTGTLDEAKAIIENQGHSGMSFGLVCSMVREFSDRGQEFVEYVR